MDTEFSGIERRLDELSERLAKLEPFKNRSLSDFQEDSYLRDIVERNLEVAAQCCIDICNRVIALENLRKPADYYEGFMILGEAGFLSIDFARDIAPVAGFRNILVHEYLQLDWALVFENLQRIDELAEFYGFIRQWLNSKGANVVP
jgi:uncharacterized protein YutE (UPF0331/DUF86 family)